MTAVDTVRAELERLAAIANKPRREEQGTLAIAKELREQGVTGRRNNRWDCPLARHLSRIAGTRVGVTRYEVIVPTTTGQVVLPLNQPPGDLLRIRYFVTQFDDRPLRFRWLREPEAAV